MAFHRTLLAALLSVVTLWCCGGGTRVERDSCLTNHGGCNANALCTSTGPGTNSCACNANYTGDGLVCTGINACAINNGGCALQAACSSTGANTDACVCNPGYLGDGSTCTAIDSCLTNHGGCDANALCTSTGPGTNSCACTANYTGDGTTCAAIGLCPAALVTAEPNDDHTHLPVGTPIVYPSNPPAGGPHWPVWAQWGVHDAAVPLEYLVHNEEHGGVILFYNLSLCTDGCPQLVAELAAFINAQPQDPICIAPDTGVQTRMVLSPDPDLDVIWAAASWGWTYKVSSACFDIAALQAFADAHYGQGSESECAQGGFN